MITKKSVDISYLKLHQTLVLNSLFHHIKTIAIGKGL